MLCCSFGCFTGCFPLSGYGILHMARLNLSGEVPCTGSGNRLRFKNTDLAKFFGQGEKIIASKIAAELNFYACPNLAFQMPNLGVYLNR